MRTLIFIFLFLILSTFLYATIINIPADQPTIQAGINVAVDGDTVLVQPETYVENINYNGKNITVASLFLTTQDTTYISNTIIDGGQPSNPDSASVVTFENSENLSAILSGFTIRNGSGTYADPSGSGYYHYLGGGIFCLDSDPNLENLQISENTVESCGAGIYCYNSNPNLENIAILYNSAGSRGGGICCKENSNPFNISTTINFSIREQGFVELNIYNIKGRLVKELTKQKMEGGEHNVTWNGKDQNNRCCSSGIYLMNLKLDGKSRKTGKVILLK